MKTFTKLGLFVIITVVFPACLVSPSLAEFKLTPSIGVREEYNDNIFLAPTNKKDDFITSISPSINLSYTASIVALSLDVGPNFRFYAKNPDQDQTNVLDTQTAKLDTTLSPYKDIFFIKVFDQYQRVPVDVTKQVAPGNYLVNLTDSNSLLISPYVEYPLSGSTKVKVGYKYANTWFKSGDSSEDQDGFAGISADLASNISAAINYDYLVHRLWGGQTFPLSDNYDQQTVSLPVVYKAGEKLSFNGSIGETWFKYKNGSSANNPSIIWNAGATYQLSSFISLSGGYSESYLYPGQVAPIMGSPNVLSVTTALSAPTPLSAGYNGAVDFGTCKAETAQGTISYSGKIPFSVTVNKTTDTYIAVARKDQLSGITLSSSTPIAPKLTGSVTGSYTYLKSNIGNESVSNSQNEKANRYSAGVSLAYEMRITTLTLGYTFNHNNSTIFTNEYTNNIVYVQAKFSI